MHAKAGRDLAAVAFQSAESMSVFFEGEKVPLPLADDLAAFRERLRQGGPQAAAAFLNARTAHRFTGVFRFDRSLLRHVAMFDKWHPELERGDDVPLADAYCSVMHATGEPFEMISRSEDARHAHLATSPIACYCGAPILDQDGRPWGALCHWDMEPCQTRTSDMPLLVAAAEMLARELVEVSQ
jgi:hypothetical protein